MSQKRDEDNGQFQKQQTQDGRKETNANDVRTSKEGARGGDLNTDTANSDK